MKMIDPLIFKSYGFYMDNTTEICFVFQDGNLLFPVDRDYMAAVRGLEPRFCEQFINLEEHFFLYDERYTCHVVYLDGGRLASDGTYWQSLPIRTILGSLGAPHLVGFEWKTLSRLMRAFHIAQWRQASRFCGFCGEPQLDATDELARQCSRCGKREYPRITPAVIIAITDQDNRLLLAHNSKFKTNIYALVAGFVEAGERLEDTVHREIREEVGIEVDSVSYVASQPWPFPASLMVAFEAKYLRGEIRCDGKEILDAYWVTPDTLPDLPGPGSISRFLIDRWLARWDYRDPGPGHR